jgi:hypothetical protein
LLLACSAGYDLELRAGHKQFTAGYDLELRAGHRQFTMEQNFPSILTQGLKLKYESKSHM